MTEQDTIEATRAPMIDPEVVLQIKALHELGWGTRSIAGELGMSRNSVKRYLRGAPPGVQIRPQRRVLDEDGVEAARELFVETAAGNAIVVTDMLNERGYEVSKRTVQRLVSSTRRELRAAQTASVRYESEPGMQMQIDFGEKRVSIAGAHVVVHLMAAVLGYSRRIFVKAFLAERAEDWREGIAQAFRHFGGVTATLLVDNARALVKRHDREARVVEFHEGLVALCRDFDCSPRACAPYRARTKGKVESGVKYVKRNALADRAFTSFAELEAHLSSWMAQADLRVHGTTHEVPLERFRRAEQVALRPLPSPRVVVRARRLQRRVANDALVDVDTVRYSVPHRLVRAHVAVDVGEARVRIYDGAQLVADHERTNEPHAKVIDAAHHEGLWRTPATKAVERLEEMGRSLADYEAIVGGGQ
jgi:transposase